MGHNTQIAPPPHRETVRAEWVDYNGHMNVAFYVLIFDQATDIVLARVGLDATYRLAANASVFVAEAHVTYEEEVREGETVMVTSRILDFDGRRLILYHEMARESDGVLAASNEVLCLHVDLGARRTAAIPAEIAARIAADAGRDAEKPRPARAGRAVGLAARRP
jgi:acyl-CoA thioester hydrolase